jgi:hypothetical protein
MDRYSIATGNIPSQEALVKEMMDEVTGAVRESCQGHLGDISPKLGETLLLQIVTPPHAEGLDCRVHGWRTEDGGERNRVYFTVVLLLNHSPDFIHETANHSVLMFRLIKNTNTQRVSTPIIAPLNISESVCNPMLGGSTRQIMVELNDSDMAHVRHVLRPERFEGT